MRLDARLVAGLFGLAVVACGTSPAPVSVKSTLAPTTSPSASATTAVPATTDDPYTAVTKRDGHAWASAGHAMGGDCNPSHLIASCKRDALTTRAAIVAWQADLQGLAVPAPYRQADADLRMGFAQQLIGLDLRAKAVDDNSADEFNASGGIVSDSGSLILGALHVVDPSGAYGGGSG